MKDIQANKPENITLPLKTTEGKGAVIPLAVKLRDKGPKRKKLMERWRSIFQRISHYVNKILWVYRLLTFPLHFSFTCIKSLRIIRMPN